MDKIDETSRKVCVTCSLEKPLNEFYQQSGKAESEVRWDKKCKVCKREAINLGRLKRPVPQPHLDEVPKCRANTSRKDSRSIGTSNKVFQRHGKEYVFESHDWEAVVRIFQKLRRWRDEKNEIHHTPKANTIELERSWPYIRLSDINENFDLKWELLT